MLSLTAFLERTQVNVYTPLNRCYKIANIFYKKSQKVNFSWTHLFCSMKDLKYLTLVKLFPVLNHAEEFEHYKYKYSPNTIFHVKLLKNDILAIPTPKPEVTDP